MSGIDICARRNRRAPSGVYTDMFRMLAVLLGIPAAFAQMAPPDPIQTAVQAYGAAHNEGRFADAVARREEARSLFGRLPAAAPNFRSAAISLEQLYENAGWMTPARALLEDALARSGGLEEWNPVRLMLLDRLAELWQQDGNLLRALSYREQAVAAQEKAPPPQPAPPAGAPDGTRVAVFATKWFTFTERPRAQNLYPYERLADLYRTLGRKEAMDGLLARVQKLAGADQGQLASFYERTNRLEDAVAIYQRIAEAQSDQADAWQALARIYERQQRYVQAAAAWRGAIAAVESSSARESFRQTIWMRQSLARVLQEAGDTAGADQVYQALLAKSANVQEGERAQILAGYASLLSGSERAAQAEALLTQYRDEHPGQPDDADVQVLMALTTAARAAGHKDAAEEFLQALQAKQERQRERLPVPQPKTISPLFKKAWGALEAGRLEEAASLTLQALDAAPGAPDRDQSPWEVSRIAMGLVNKKAPAKGEQLYQQLFTTVQTWAKDSPTALLAARENYARFLAQQPARSNDVPDAIQKYREELSAVNGGGTGRVAEALHLAIDFEGSKPEGTRSMRPAEELVAFEASLSGTTSQPYEQALVTLAEFYAWAGERERLLALWKQIVSISDLVEPATIQAAFLRMGAAQVYAKQRQFDEADRLAAEAVTIAKKRMPGSRMYETIAQQIREMRDQSLRQ